MFSKELHGLLLEQEIEFCFDVILSTELISIPHYRMALAKLKELKAQLQDLINKGFI